MTDALIETTIVATFGRERRAHTYRVHIEGNDQTGYQVRTYTSCGRRFDDTTKTSDGIPTCPDCERAER